jgi:hypothetical protein
MSDALQAHVTKDHEEALAKLKGLEDSAETEEEREVYRAGRASLEKQGPIKTVTSDVMMSAYNDPKLPMFAWLDSLTSVPLNLALIVSGLGLIQMQEWGRKLALWVAGLKILRILAVQGFWIFGVVPGFSRRVGLMVNDMLAQQGAAGGGGGAPIGIDFTMIYMVMYTVIGVMTIIAVCIYPIVSLVVLRRNGVRAALLASAKPASETA